MPYKDKAKQREYQRELLAKRRADYMADKSCVWKMPDGTLCGSEEYLEVDHIDPTKKWTHRFWSYCEKKRNAELKKCQVLCRVHHQEKTNGDYNYGLVHGTVKGYDYYNCRCQPCKDAHNKMQNEWRWRTGRRTKRGSDVDTQTTTTQGDQETGEADERKSLLKDIESFLAPAN